MVGPHEWLTLRLLPELTSFAPESTVQRAAPATSERYAAPPGGLQVLGLLKRANTFPAPPWRPSRVSDGMSRKGQGDHVEE